MTSARAADRHHAELRTSRSLRPRPGSDERHDGPERIEPACPLFDWYVKPHLDSPSFRNRDEAWADRLAASVDFPLYLLDDDSAIRVRGDKVDVVSTGRWGLVGR